MAPTYYNWCFTVNNYTTDVIDLHDDMKYLVYGREVAPETGTKHLQGFVVLHKKSGFKTVKALLPEGCHIEACKGTAVQNMGYCKKGGDFVEQGEAGRSLVICYAGDAPTLFTLDYRELLDVELWTILVSCSWLS